MPEDATWSAPTFAYGGAGRDVLIADTGRARMFDWGGEFNSFIVPFSPFGAPVVNRSFSPWIRDFITALSTAGGQDQTFTPFTPLDETAMSTPKDQYWQAQHGGPRDPQPGNVPGVGIDYRGLVDLGAGCPCNQGTAIAVKGAVNAADPLNPTPYEDAQIPPGATVAPGAPVTLTYLVTDPGTSSLQVLSITDDNATPADPADDFHPVYVSGDTNGNGLIDPGEVWYYTSAGVPGAPTTGIVGSYQHVVTVVGLDPAASVVVRAADPTNYTVTSPTVQIAKDINAVNPLNPTVTEQADTQATAPHLAAGTPITWTYRVTTSSTTPIQVLSVMDDNGTPSISSDDWAPLPVTTIFGGKVYNVGDTNYDGLLEPGETWLYTSAGVPGIATTARQGWNVNVGTVTATDAAGDSFVATNPAWYLGTTGLGLVKAVNAVDPQHPTALEDANSVGPMVAVGSTVRFSYLVTNSSGGPMQITGLVDDNATPANPADDVHLGAGGIMPLLDSAGFNVGDTNHNGVFDAGESWVFTWSRVVTVVGSFTNHATVSAINDAGQTVTATDLANYTVGGGHVTLHTAVNAAVPLSPTPAEDANTPPGPILTVGSSATFTYLVVNDGFLPLSGVAVTDNHGFTPLPVLASGTSFNIGDTNKNGLLDVGETWLYTSSGATTITVTPGLYTDLSGVTAVPCVGTPLTCTSAPVTSTDPTYFTGAAAGLTVVKAVNAANPLSPTTAEDANNPASPYYVTTGQPVVFTYLVSSTNKKAKIPGSAIVLTDDNGTPNNPADDFHPVYVSGDQNGNGYLDHNEVWLYTSAGVAGAQSVALAGLHGNVAQVIATVGSTTYGAQDVAWYKGITAGIAVKKATNAVDPLAPTASEEGDTTAHQLYLPVGTPLVWTYRVTNTGTTPLRVSGIVDDNGTPANTSDDFAPLPVTVTWNGATYNTGDTNHNGLLDVGEVWLYTSAGVSHATVAAGEYKNTATVTGVEPHLGTVVTASDVSYHFGALNKLVVRKAVNAADPLHPTAYEDANYAPGPVLTAGSTVTWTYLVTNLGNTALDVSSLIDDNGTGSPDTGFAVDPVLQPNGNVVGDANDNGVLDPGETWLYSATGVVPLGEYMNTATVTATVLGQSGAGPHCNRRGPPVRHGTGHPRREVPQRPALDRPRFADRRRHGQHQHLHLQGHRDDRGVPVGHHHRRRQRHAGEHRR